MKNQIRYLTGLILILTAPLHGGDIALQNAEQYSGINNYHQAIVEYKRFIYFNPDYEFIADIYYRLGMACKNLGQLENAIQSIELSVRHTICDSIKNERMLDIAVLNLAAKNYTEAEFQLLRIAHFNKDSHLKRRAFFLLGVSYLYNYKWDDAQEMFQKAFINSTNSTSLGSLFVISQRLGYKNPVLAKWLSTFVPGSGQIYCGDWRNGINAFALNSLLGYALVESILDLRYIDIIFTTSPYFERYYTGNRDNSEMIARDHNENKNKRMATDILKEVRYLSENDE